MKLILPNGSKIELDKDLPYDEKRKVVEGILDEWNPYFSRYKNRKTLVCLDVLSNYLCYEKIEKHPELQVGE
jgi:hypothetical protein